MHHLKWHNLYYDILDLILSCVIYQFIMQYLFMLILFFFLKKIVYNINRSRCCTFNFRTVLEIITRDSSKVYTALNKWMLRWGIDSSVFMLLRFFSVENSTPKFQIYAAFFFRMEGTYLYTNRVVKALLQYFSWVICVLYKNCVYSVIDTMVFSIILQHYSVNFENYNVLYTREINYNYMFSSN